MSCDQERYRMNLSHLKFPAYVVAVGLVIGFFGDLMLYNQPLGISVPILALLLVIGLLGLAVVEGSAIVWANLWLIVPTLALAAFAAVRAEPTLRFMNTVGAMMLGLLLANRLASRPQWELNLGQMAAAVIESAVVSLVIPLPLLVRALNEPPQGERGRRRRSIRGVVIGLVIAVPFLIVFTALFSSADLIFNDLVRKIIEAIQLPDIIGHTFLTLVLGWLAMGGLAYGLTRLPVTSGFVGLRVQSGEEAAEPPDTADAEPRVTLTEDEPAAHEVTLKTQGFNIRALLGALESSVMLFAIDALFGVFVAIQAVALFGGEAFVRSQGLTYSDYARRGFFELLTVSLITLGLILTIDVITRRETARQHSIFLVASGLMVGLTIVILASAFARMQLYELAYGFTRLRVYPHVFMVWLAILLALFLATLIARRVRWFATAALAVCIGFVMTMNILNPDALIVRQNLARGQAGEEVDADYLGSLSEDAVPDLLPLLDDARYQKTIGPWLHVDLMRLDSRQAHAGVGAYHLSINTAYQLLDQRRADVEKFDISTLRYLRQD
jgi:Domain of unknown function (DUF4153)